MRRSKVYVDQGDMKRNEKGKVMDSDFLATRAETVEMTTFEHTLRGRATWNGGGERETRNEETKREGEGEGH